MAKLFDFFRNKKVYQDEEVVPDTKIAAPNDDGAVIINDAVNNFVLRFDWMASSQEDLINKYREISNYSEVDFAIQEIINEAVSFAENEDPVKLNLDGLDLSDAVKKKIQDSWDHISNILNLKETIHQRLTNFYVDGRLAYQKVVSKDRLSQGLIDVVELDTRYVSKFRNIVYDEQDQTIRNIQEFFIYNENTKENHNKDLFVNKKNFKEVLQLSKESITYVTSGLVDPKTGYAISWLHKAIKPANQLRMMENALVIYRITRAPERRVFYIDVGNLPKSKAEQYLTNLKNSYRNRMSYDPENGTFKDDKHLMTMQEDFWLPRSANGNGTQIDTLAAGANLGDIEDVLYFLKRLYKSLNIPVSRFDQQDALVNFGASNTEMSREEMKLSKFVSKVRKRFNVMFKDILRTHLILTKVLTAKEWSDIQDKIDFVYAQDLYVEERKRFEIMRDRLELLKDIEPYIGKYFSHSFVRSKIIQQTDEEMKEEDKLIKDEEKIKQFQPPEEESNFN